jgi:regulator of sigma D
MRLKTKARGVLHQETSMQSRNKRSRVDGDSRGVDALLRRWLAERQELLSRYCALSAAQRVGSSGTGGALLDRFCEVLVDYASAGHFEVYRELLEEGERSGNGRSAEVAALYRLIVPTTAIALDFNDRYFRGASGNRLEQDLSRLGQVLASRFDLEDALIRQLHGAVRAVA